MYITSVSFITKTIKKKKGENSLRIRPVSRSSISNVWRKDTIMKILR